jgi:hypothetical protein
MKSIACLGVLASFSVLATAACVNATEEEAAIGQTRQAVSQAVKDACSFKYNQVTTLTTTDLVRSVEGLRWSVARVR